MKPPHKIRRLFDRCRAVLLCVVCLAFFFPFWCFHVSAGFAQSTSTDVQAQSTPEVVRVGRFPYDEQLKKDANGNYSGYGFEYLQEIARYAGWRYEFVDAPWDACLAMLERGEIDLLGAVIRSPKREAVMDFSNTAMISGYGVLATPLDNATLPYEDFLAFNGLAVGALRGNLHAPKFLKYCAAHGVSPRLHLYDTQAEMDAALQSGAIKAIVMTNLLRSSHLRVIAAFGEDDGYFATTKGNAGVLRAVNEAMRRIRLNNPHFNTELDHKYYNLQAATAVSFTREELDFIRNSPPIPCVYIPSAFPDGHADADPRTKGTAAVDVCRLLEKRTGLSFVWVYPSSESEADDMLRRGDVLVLPAKIDDFNWAKQNHAVFTEPYLQDQMVMISNKDMRNAGSVALYDLALRCKLTPLLASGAWQFKKYDTVNACMEAVLYGEVDATFLSSSIAFSLTSNPKYAQLQTSPLYGLRADTGMAVSKMASPLLLPILDKGLRNISPAEINQIVLSRLKGGQSGPVANFLYLHPLETVLFMAFVFLALMVALSILFYHRLKSARQIARILYTDTLTGHPNYRALLQESARLIGGHPERYALVYMDIYRFKVINDTFGYEAGDRVLAATSDMLKNFVQADERFARVHADIFVLLVRYAGQKELKERLTGLFNRLGQLCSEGARKITPLFCGGVYPLARDFGNLDRACDRANYAKSSIRRFFSSTFVFYDDVMRSQVLEEKELEGSMLSALSRGEFVPFYQPKVNAITERVVGAEALVRWMHPEKGCLAPSEFIPFYEKNGFIVKIDLAIFEQVCCDMRQWKDRGSPMIPVSVNFSRRHMLNRELPEKLKEIVDRHQIPSRFLDIEITETEELENVDMAVDFVSALKKYGFSVSIDDYGTGYSSISFLQQLPLDTLKLDRAFILNAMKTAKARDVMRYLVTAMHNNNVRIMCEGVETREQRDFVLSLNCRFVQGYFYSEPLSRKNFEVYLLKYGIETPGQPCLCPHDPV